MTPEHPRRPDSSSDPSRESIPSSLDWIGQAGLTEQFLQKIESRMRRRRRRQTIAAGFAALLLVGFGWFLGMERARPASVPAASRALVYLPARQVLPDGSIVELNEGAHVDVAFTENVRRVVLRGGEAHFQVAKNPLKPFLVAAGGVEVRAVGTAFLVQLGPEVEVLVTEGRVSVDPAVAHPGLLSAAASSSLLFLDAGSRGFVPADSPRGALVVPRVVTMSEADIRERLSWRLPRLEFSQAPLSQVIALINQHGRVHLALADPELGKLELSGVLRADNTETLLQMLNSNYGIEAEQGQGRILLHRAR